VNRKSVLRALNQVDWDFADYYGSRQFPADINSLHWYPAIFVPQIPAILIQILSNAGDLVLDPFAGAGSTLIEASRLRRRFVGVDLNPYAVNITRAKILAISRTDEEWYDSEKKNMQQSSPIVDPQKVCDEEGIDPEVFEWFEEKTLSELLAIRRYIIQRKSSPCNLVLQVIFSSILNKCCSQRDHYTYVTDKCFPKEMIYRPAMQYFFEQLELTRTAVVEAKRQFQRVHGCVWDPLQDGIIECGDARNLEWIADSSIDLVVTSPPYLGVNDYVRSMRLTWLLFPEEGTEVAIREEIGARRKRQRKRAYEEYFRDLEIGFKEIGRVLKPSGFLALVIGQGRGQVNKNDVTTGVLKMLQDNYAFQVLFASQRRIKFRRIQVPGVGTEKVVVLGRQEA
jgi:DNA modification methylase